jgi:class 3 adenylate cyclase
MLPNWSMTARAAPAQSHRALRTVLFTDMVASTQRAAAMGDERWRAVLDRFGEVTTELTQRFGGTVVKSTGDGHLATFDGPTQAIRCAEALRAEVTGEDCLKKKGRGAPPVVGQ